jgi:hypothetical protein
MAQTPRRYPGEFFLASVNRFTFVRQTGSDNSDRQSTKGVARSRSAAMGLFDRTRFWRAAPCKHAKAARAPPIVCPK